MKNIFRIFFLIASVSLVLSACSNDNAEELLSSAKKYLKQNDKKAAIIQIKNSLQKSPDFAEARYLLGKTLLEGGDVTGAVIELRKALDLHYPTAQVLPLLAKALVAGQEYKKLTDKYGNTKLSEKSAAADFETSKALAYGVQGNTEKSQIALQAAFQAVPDYPPALLLKARIQAAQDRLDEALALVEKALSETPTLAEAWQFKAELLLYGKNDETAALEAYRKALEFAPNYFPARSGILSLLFAQHNMKEAAVQMEGLRKAFPQNPQTKYYEAHLAYLNHDYTKARDMVQQVLKIAPDNAKVLQLAGAIEFEAGSLVQAENYLSKALQRSPDLPVARRLLAKTYLRAGQPAKTLAVLEIPLARGEPDAETLSLAAEAHTQAGDMKRAEAYLAKVVKLKPNDVKTRSALALSRMNGDNAEATFAELEVIAKTDKGLYADQALATAYILKKDFEGALKAIEAIEQKQPNRPSTVTLKGRVYLMSKDLVQARRSYERALEIDPVFVPAAAGLAMLDLADKKPEVARKRFESVLAIDPKNMQALLAVAGLKARSNAPKEEVVALLRNAIRLNPAEPVPRLSLIEFYLGQHDGKAALLAAQDATAALKNVPELIDALGRAQVEAGEKNQAIGTFNKLAALQPDSPRAAMHLAEIHFATKNYDAARRVLNQALVAKPDFLAAQKALVQVELAATRSQDALAIARTVQKQRPSEPVGFMMQGVIEAAGKNFAAATETYKTALDKFGSPEIATKLHSVLNLAHKEAEADKFAASWMRGHPKDVNFPFYLGEISLAKRDYAAAESYFRQVIKVQPENALALNNTAWIMATLEKPGAVELAQKAVALLPDTPPLLDTLAMALAAENNTKQAIEIQKKALTFAPDNPVFRLRLAKLYIKAGDRASARSELVALSKLNERFSLQAEVGELLKGL